MPPDDPGSMAEDYQELLAAWENGPENTPGAEWVIPPARGEPRQIVGDEYPYKMRFNVPGQEAGTGTLSVGIFGQKSGKSDKKTANAEKDKEPVDLDALGARLKQAVQNGELTEAAAMAKYKAAAGAGKGKK